MSNSCPPSPIEILSRIRAVGGRCVVEDSDILVYCPVGVLAPGDIEVLRQYKSDLLAVLPDAERESIVWVESLEDLPMDQAIAALARSSELKLIATI